MKYSTRLSDAVHVLVLIYLNQDNGGISSAEIAESVHSNPALIRQIMAELKAAELIESARGKAKPRLAAEPARITLLNVYRAMEGRKPLLHIDTHINPACEAGTNIQYALGDFYARVQDVAERELDGITLADVVASYYEKLAASQGGGSSADGETGAAS
ncbi:MAG: Rrf2 family transcriptional regulator [Eggerthellaceae bacterium]|nr:Rrf2 family transcriptional regulator [Eggerthellaceae bacterium]